VDPSFPSDVRVAFQTKSELFSSSCILSNPSGDDVNLFTADRLLVAGTDVQSSGVVLSFPSEECESVANIDYLNSRLAGKYFRNESETYVVHDSIGETVTIFSNICDGFTSLELDVVFLGFGQNRTQSLNDTFLPCNVPLGVVFGVPTLSFINDLQTPFFSIPIGITPRSRLWELGGVLLANCVILFIEMFIWYNKL